jgi:hypothetical protein
MNVRGNKVSETDRKREREREALLILKGVKEFEKFHLFLCLFSFYSHSLAIVYEDNESDDPLNHILKA